MKVDYALVFGIVMSVAMWYGLVWLVVGWLE